MHAGPIQVLQAARRGGPSAPLSRLLVAGAGGALGNEVMRRLVGRREFACTEMLAREPMRPAMRGVAVRVVPDAEPAQWPLAQADTGIVLFDPPRLFYQRERALWTPAPRQVPALGAWMRRSGVATLAVVMPHQQGRLPEALKRGLADLDEQALAALGFERLLIVRSPQAPGRVPAASQPAALARWMLGVFKYMVPGSEQPVRAVKVAQFVATLLRAAPPGIHIAAPEIVWQASQRDPAAVVGDWLQG